MTSYHLVSTIAFDLGLHFDGINSSGVSGWACAYRLSAGSSAETCDAWSRAGYLPGSLIGHDIAPCRFLAWFLGTKVFRRGYRRVGRRFLQRRAGQSSVVWFGKTVSMTLEVGGEQVVAILDPYHLLFIKPDGATDSSVENRHAMRNWSLPVQVSLYFESPRVITKRCTIDSRLFTSWWF